MDERIQRAMHDILAIARQSNALSRRDQELLADRLETIARELEWQLYFFESALCQASPETILHVGRETVEEIRNSAT